MSSYEAQRLLQAIEQFQERTKGADLPKGTEDALKGLRGVLEQDAPARDTPGARAAHAAAPGSGAFVPLERPGQSGEKASPGQRAAAGVSEAIEKAAAEIAT